MPRLPYSVTEVPTGTLNEIKNVLDISGSGQLNRIVVSVPGIIGNLNIVITVTIDGVSSMLFPRASTYVVTRGYDHSQYKSNFQFGGTNAFDLFSKCSFYQSLKVDVYQRSSNSQGTTFPLYTSIDYLIDV